MRSGVRWDVAEAQPKQTEALATILQISPISAQILWNRGLREEVAARLFMSCQLRDLTDPFLLPDMRPAVERTMRALLKNETIVLYGDYDVDGVASVALLKRLLTSLGATQVHPFLPDRFDDGYGLTAGALARCMGSVKPTLIIVLDCGTNSCAEIEGLVKSGVDVIVVDHHEPSTPARPLALLNYKVRKDPSVDGFCEYCTAGLAFKFGHALLKFARQQNLPHAEEVDLKIFLDLVALATVADIAPLTGENRIFARHGLREMARTKWMGLRALMHVSQIQHEPNAYDCGFKLGPRLNAAGRLESAMAALQLLLCEDEDQAGEIARQLDTVNRERQTEEARVWAEARADAEMQAQDPSTRVLVLARAGWHEGVVGIVASRIVREFYLPTFVIALNETGMGKGSGRSIEGFNLSTAVDSTRSFLLKGGGHAMAAGVSVHGEQVGPWRQALQSHARVDQGLEGELLKRKVRIDAEVTMAQLDLKLIEELERLEPCGMSNPRALLLVKNVEVAAEPRTVGADRKHLKLWLRQNGASMDAIAFGKGSLVLRKGSRINVVFELELNEYQGNRKAQMNIREIAEVAV